MANTIKIKRGSGSDPSASSMVLGEPVLRTDTAELFFKKDDGSVAKVSGGGGGPDFKYLALRNAANNGAASFPGDDFTLVTSGTTTAKTPTAANTLLVSVSGVIQQPNTGTSTSGITGFIVDGSRIKFGSNIPAAPDFILYQESGGIGEPSDNTVSLAKLTASGTASSSTFLRGDNTWSTITSYTHPNHSGEVTSSGDGATTIASNVVDEDNLKISNSGSNGQFLQKQSGNSGGLTWETVDLTALSASNLTSGTVPDARFPSTLPAASGTNLTALNASNISSGTIAAARVATLNQNTTGSAATLTTARNIGGVSFNGSANIDLPGVNAAGNQNTSGTSAGLTGTPNITVADVVAASVTTSGVTNLSGELRANANVKISNVGPKISLVDTNNDDDFEIKNNNGVFTVRDATNSVDRFTINSEGNISAGGTITSTFSGSGAALTSLNANNLSSGTVAAARLDEATTQSAGNNSTKIATTAFVSTAVTNLIGGAPGALDTLNELAAAINDDSSFASTVTTSLGTKLNTSGGTLTGDVTFQGATSGRDILWDKSGNIFHFKDNAGAQFGDHTDLKIFHDGSNSQIREEGTGNLMLITDNQIRFEKASPGTAIASFNVDNACELYFQGSKTFETISGGATVTGQLYVTAELNLINGSSNAARFIDCGLGDNNALTIRGTSGGDASHETLAKFIRNGACELYFDTDKRFETQATGCKIHQGNSAYGLNISGSEDGKMKLSGSSNPYIRFQEGSTDKAYIQWNASGYVELRNQEDGSTLFIKDALTFAQSVGGTEHTIWHSGNDGSGSGLDADTLDGVQAGGFLRADAADAASGDITFSGGAGAATIGANSDIRLHNGTWSGDFGAKIQHHDNTLFLQGGSGGIKLRNAAGTKQLIMNGDGHFFPAQNNAYDLGTSGNRWRDLYIMDLQLSNEGKTNDVDGTWGDWTLQEGEENIFMINNRSGKKYKMALQEVS